ncbi:peptide chain release factor N(5)-glutamine methyltransferase [Gryllotalpicola koreensis]|uniref:peptide chain release factor N(5)-glutamine methyltransferase n=1 Tax=Gryllotalpicola koreensis TaxID=993086 RepID=UPI0031D93509
MNTTPVTIRALLSEVTAQLSAADVPTPGIDAALLIGFVTDASRGRVQAMALTDAQAEASIVDRVRELAARRAAREPLQHITGTAAFRSLELAVGPGVFVPRPETEHVAQFAIDALRQAASPEPLAVDLGSGSGAIALSLAVEVPHARVFAVEKSPEALPWTRRNFAASGAANATLIEGDLADPAVLSQLDGRVDVVISNPPYVPDEAIPRDPEVRLFDPAMALYGGPDGLDLVRALSRTALRLAHPGALLVIEHGELQGEAIRALLAADGWRAASTHPDLTGRDRATTALRP